MSGGPKMPTCKDKGKDETDGGTTTSASEHRVPLGSCCRLNEPADTRATSRTAPHGMGTRWCEQRKEHSFSSLPEGTANRMGTVCYVKGSAWHCLGEVPTFVHNHLHMKQSFLTKHGWSARYLTTRSHGRNTRAPSLACSSLPRCRIRVKVLLSA